jgi:DNA-binding transcriptional LysR family regulator
MGFMRSNTILEEDLGVALPYRNTRKVELTYAGDAFASVAHASGIALRANRGVVGELVLGYTPSRDYTVAKLYRNVRISLRDMS